MDFEEFKEELENQGFKKFLSKQLYNWLFDNFENDLNKMNNLSGPFKEYLRENYIMESINILEVQNSKDETLKFLLELADGEKVELVLMRYFDQKNSKKRNTLCISSQVGCQIGCAFCATGMEGFTRNLSASEILEEVFLSNKYLAEYFPGERVSNVVFMGMGEPFLNFDNVLQGSSRISEYFDISKRRISISTSGLTKEIRKFGDLDNGNVLAISLHSAQDSVRSNLIPINYKYNLAELKSACLYYSEVTGKRITFEYILIKDINMDEESISALREFLRDLKYHLNVIPYNKVKGLAFEAPKTKEIRTFVDKLKSFNINVTERKKMGNTIDGACGQLKRNGEGKNR